MDEYARSETLDDLKALLLALNEQGVEYLLMSKGAFTFYPTLVSIK